MNPLPDPLDAGGAGWVEVVVDDDGGDPVGGAGAELTDAVAAGADSVAGPPGTSMLRAVEASAAPGMVSAPVAAVVLRRTGRDDAGVAPSEDGVAL